MARKGKTRADQTRLKDEKIKALERALREERLALIAISTAFLRETENPARLVARLEAMARQATAPGSKLSEKTKVCFVAGYQMIRRAAAAELSKPQPLFDGSPNPGHPDPEQVKALAAPAQEQMGLAANGGLEDAEQAVAERGEAATKVQDMIVAIVQQYGPISDGNIFRRYAARPDRIPISERGVKQYRQGLVQGRKLVRAGRDDQKRLLFDIVGRST